MQPNEGWRRAMNARLVGDEGTARLRRLIAVVVAALVVGSMLTLAEPKASAAIGDLTYVRCYGAPAADGGQQPDGCPDASAPATQVHGTLVSPDERFLYSWDGARSFGNLLIGEIHLYRRDVTGGITYVTCYGNNRGCTSFDANNQSIHDVEISPDGKFLYAVDYLGQAIYAFARNQETGGLTFASCVRDAIPSDTRPSPCREVAALRFPIRLAMTSGDGVGASVFAATAQGGITWFARDLTTGSLTFAGCMLDKKYPAVSPCATAPGLSGAQGVAVSRDGGSVFVGGRANLVVLSRPALNALQFVSCFGNARTDSTDLNFFGDGECTPVAGLGGSPTWTSIRAISGFTSRRRRAMRSATTHATRVPGASSSSGACGMCASPRPAATASRCRGRSTSRVRRRSRSRRTGARST